MRETLLISVGQRYTETHGVFSVMIRDGQSTNRNRAIRLRWRLKVGRTCGRSWPTTTRCARSRGSLPYHS